MRRKNEKSISLLAPIIVALSIFMKIIPSKFQILAENRHYKIANTSFLFLLLSLKIDRKMTQRIGEFFFFYVLH